MPHVQLILATNLDGVIGIRDNSVDPGRLPWHCPDDLKFFSKQTEGTTLIMGRKTAVSLPQFPLPGRPCRVVSTHLIERFKDVVDSNIYASILAATTPIMSIIGGARLAQTALTENLCSTIYLSVIDAPTPTKGIPIYLPPALLPLFSLIKRVYYPGKEEKISPTQEWSATLYCSGERVRVFRCTPANTEEQQFQDLIRHVYQQGETRLDRTTIGTRSCFAPTQLKFSLRENRFPLQTCRKSSFATIFKELIWFLRGQTDSKILEADNVKIWTGNSSREFLEKNNLPYQPGDCGPVYGFQWRHWGATYRGCSADYTGQGHDQIQDLIDTIRKSPYSRRLLLSGWNVSDLSAMVLPPCHTLYHFYVSSEKRLSCHLYQRSSDLLLAGHWNISSASLLTILLAAITGLEPDFLAVSYGDAHLYQNHLAAVPSYLERVPIEYPKLRVKRVPEKIEQFTLDDLELTDYFSYPSLPLPMNP